MAHSKWELNDLDNVLSEIIFAQESGIMDVYTIARIIEDQYEDTFRGLGFAIGGEHSGAEYSLPMYLARFGPDRIEKGHIQGIAHVLLTHIKEGDQITTYKDGSPLTSSVNGPSGFKRR